jgi:hypothetical protein
MVAKFNMNKSGAVMAWEFCHPGEAIPLLLQYIQDRDLWQHGLPNTHEIHAAVASYPTVFTVWQNLEARMGDQPDPDDQECNSLVVEGESILRERNQLVTAIVDLGWYRAKIDDFNVAICNGPYPLASDIGHYLLNGDMHSKPIVESSPKCDFAASYYIGKDGRYVYSLRSDDNHVDVSEVARKYGGGGHRNSAGFRSNFSIHHRIKQLKKVTSDGA